VNPVTRADEIADEFETPFPGRPELRRPDPNASGPDGLRLPDGSPRDGNGSGAAISNGNHGSRRPRVLKLEPDGSVELAQQAGELAETGAAAEPSQVKKPGEDSGESATGTRSEANPDAGDTDSEKVVPRSHHDTLPEKARAAAGTWLKAAGWTAGTSLRVTGQIRKVATDPGAAQEIIDEMTREVREVARDFLGITELDGQVQEMAPLLSSGLLKAGGSSREALRAQGEALLRQAADVGFDESAHPAFARILTELSPDEARILRLLAIEGAQPMVDVRASHLIGNGSQLIAQSLNMLGPKAGLRQRDRVPVYLTNLVRLSLVVLADDPLERPAEYQVLEAQPEVLATLRDTVRAKTIRRSVLLTPLGQEFCEVCLPVKLPALPPPQRVD
jgi:hypothetical protein